VKTSPEPLLAKLQRANLQVALSTLAVVAVTLIMITFWTLRIYVEQNLSLVGRSIAYTAQAAVVFNDMEVAQEILTVIAEKEKLAEVNLLDSKGVSLAHFYREEPSSLAALLSPLATILLPHTATSDIVHEGVRVGQVRLRAGFSIYAQFLLEVIIALAFSLGLVLLLCRWLSRKFENDIVKPLDQLASLTRAARVNRALDMRTPAASVLEINALGEDFYALMTEIQGQDIELRKRQGTLEETNELLSHQASHDGLTGLPNRTCFLGQLAKSIQTNGPRKDMLAVMYIDCDHFKLINDTLGHAAGDEVLVEFARRMKTQLRDGDMVARLGGDEFAVMLSPIRRVDDAHFVAAKLIATFAEPIWTQSAGKVMSSATIGVAFFPAHGVTLDALLKCADAVMYRAKKQQKGTYIVAQDFDVQASMEVQTE
jgi:diguanylate cyclase